jgi:hypothetical protein
MQRNRKENTLLPFHCLYDDLKLAYICACDETAAPSLSRVWLSKTSCKTVNPPKLTKMLMPTIRTAAGRGPNYSALLGITRGVAYVVPLHGLYILIESQQVCHCTREICCLETVRRRLFDVKLS